MIVITENVVETLKRMPEGQATLLIVIPPVEEDVLLDDLIEFGYRALARKGELIAAKSLPAALAIL